MGHLHQNATIKDIPITGQYQAAGWFIENITTTIIAVIIVSLTYGFLSGKRYRESVIKRSGALKMPPGNKWFGSVPAMVEMYKTSPQDTHPQATMTLLQREHKLDNVWFMDTWPLSKDPQLIIVDPDVAAQVTQTKSLPKHSEVRRFIMYITGTRSLIFTEGDAWKKPRTLFNPGFALSHLMTLVPSIVDDVTVFCSVLEEKAASGEVFQFEDLAAKLMFDIMGHIVLDHNLNSQTGPNELVDCFRGTVEWSPPANSINPFLNHNPIAYIAHKWYGRHMDIYISEILDERYKTKRGQDIPQKKGRKPAIDLAIDEYAKQEAAEGRQPGPTMDPEFKAMAIDQMKSFLFAGHDTSSTTMCFIYHNLSRNPEAQEKLKEEHDRVFGTDPTKAAAIMKENPQLLNKLPYTTGVIKETLRLFPPASTVRSGHPDININYKGNTYSTTGCLVWIVSHAMHRRPDLFPEPDNFIPERFLPADDPNRFQEIPKDAFRPFEKGPRNCIGQELALLEMKIAVVMTFRIFEVRNAYEQWDRSLGREKPGEQLGGTRGMFGDRAYQVLQASAKPKDGFPATVKMRVL